MLTSGFELVSVSSLGFGFLLLPLYLFEEYSNRKTLKRETPVPVCSQKLSPVNIWMGDHLDKVSCAVLLGKSGWCSGHQSHLPSLLQYCMWIEVDLNLISPVSSLLKIDS